MTEISPTTALHAVYTAMSTLSAIGTRYPIDNDDWNTAHKALSRIARQLEQIESKSIQCPQYTPYSEE